MPDNKTNQLELNIKVLKNPTYIPPHGYILPNWKMKMVYRATALAYMQREKKDQVENENGITYTLEQIRNAVLGYSLFEN